MLLKPNSRNPRLADFSHAEYIMLLSHIAVWHFDGIYYSLNIQHKRRFF